MRRAETCSRRIADDEDHCGHGQRRCDHGDFSLSTMPTGVGAASERVAESSR
jgi:hypothetical protein